MLAILVPRHFQRDRIDVHKVRYYGLGIASLRHRRTQLRQKLAGDPGGWNLAEQTHGVLGFGKAEQGCEIAAAETDLMAAPAMAAR